ncbi:hypothetical protein EW145_g7019 [Phellinidium pouzarii]|uniref:Reverse transcriptase domain-containing protein n=1 Tax=Phellinidium pouzarii TaxID=167371 RepID=A0A4S4KV27_9AGAM|nr:hypothetical protein EW145_g7019 [Phellinidium pouzarii]
MDKLRGAKYFTKLDLRSGYNNIRIKEGDQYKAAFKTIRGLFEPTVMFFGLCNSPATFQMFMNDIFHIIITEEAILIYMDDILIFSDNLEDLRRKTNRVLRVLQDNDLFLKPEKCVFEVQEVEFLGMILRPDNIHMDPVKLAGIQQWPEPHTVKQLRSFLGFCNFYRRFIPNYSSIAYPLNELTRTNEPWKWNELRTNAFITLKNLFSSQPALLIPDKTKPFILETDASKVASGAVLYQANSNGDLQPCGFISEAFGPAQQRYEVYDRELLGIIRGLTAWRHYLLGAPHTMIIWCDHKNLSYFRAARRLTPRQSRWNLFLSQFDISITHKPGKDIPGADSLSRRPDYSTEPDEERTLLPNTLFIGRIDVNLHNRIKESQATDQLANTILRAKTLNIPSPFKFSLDDWTTDSDLLLFRKRIYIPDNKDLKQQILHLFHDLPSFGHPGIFKTTSLIRQHYWWPGLTIFTTTHPKALSYAPVTKPLTPLALHSSIIKMSTAALDSPNTSSPTEALNLHHMYSKPFALTSASNPNSLPPITHKLMAKRTPNTWTESIPDLEFSHNLQTHSVTKTSPFNIILGYNPIPIPPAIEPTNLPSLSERLRLLTTI